MSKRIFLVTGANGFVGSNLVRLLSSRGEKVRALVRDPKKAVDLAGLSEVEVVCGDLCDEESLRRAASGVYGVYHIAATYRDGGLTDEAYRQINTEGTRRMLDAAIASGAQRFVHCSTVGVHGDVERGPADENAPYNPGDIYQRTKLEGEKIAMEYFRSGKIRGVVIRPAIIFGPGDMRTLKIFRMVAKGRFFYVGRGEKNVHFVDVRDLVEAFRLSMEREDITAELFIIPGQKAVPLREMIRLIAKETGVREPKLQLPVKPVQLIGSICEAVCIPLGIRPPIYRRRVDFYTKNRHFTGKKAEQVLGFRPRRSFEEEIADISKWYREHGLLD